MENNRLQPLNDVEKRMSEEHHGLVYSFLHRHGYSIEEFYNICIFGYLKAIQTYNRREDLRKKYQLAFICEQYMRAEVKDHFRVQNAQKRKPTEIILSLDAEYSELEDSSTRGNLYNCVGGKSVEDELMESELIEEVLENLSEVQRDILKLKLEGFSNKEVYLSLEIPTSTYYKELDRIKVIFKGLVG